MCLATTRPWCMARQFIPTLPSITRHRDTTRPAWPFPSASVLLWAQPGAAVGATVVDGAAATTMSTSITTTTSSTTATGTTSTAATGTTSTAATGTTSTTATAATATGSTTRSTAAGRLMATEAPPISTVATLAATPCSRARTTLARTREHKPGSSRQVDATRRIAGTAPARALVILETVVGQAPAT